MKPFSQQIAVVLLVSLVGCQTAHFTRQEQIDALRYQTMQNHWQWVTRELTRDIEAYAGQTKGIELDLDTLRTQVYEKDGSIHFSYGINIDLVDPTVDKDKQVWSRLFAIVRNPGFFSLGKDATKDLSPTIAALLNQWQTCPGVTRIDHRQPNSIHVFLSASQPLVLEHPPPVPIAKNREEAEILLLSLVADMFTREDQKLTVLHESTISGLTHLRENLFEGYSFDNKPLTPSAETMADFRLANATSASLSRKIRTSVRRKFVREEKLKGLFEKEDGWKAFRKEYPKAHGFLRLSRPGMNADRSEALVYVEHSAGWLEGSGQFFLFRKIEGRWIMIGQACTWVS